MPSYPGESFLQFLRNGSAHVAAEFEALYGQLQGYLGVEHNPDGTHSDITADSVTADDATITDLITTTIDTTSLDVNSLTFAGGDAVTTYDEGTWTPAIKFGGAATGITYSDQTGYYTRIGRIVHATCAVVLTSKGSATGTARIDGLPFTAVASASAYAGLFSSFAAGVTLLSGFAVGATTRIDLYNSGAGSMPQLTDAEFTNTSTFVLTATYFV